MSQSLLINKSHIAPLLDVLKIGWIILEKEAL